MVSNPLLPLVVLQLLNTTTSTNQDQDFNFSNSTIDIRDQIVDIPLSSREEVLNNERRLMFDLFKRKDYNPLIRPVVNITEFLEIQFVLALSQIIAVDEVNQMMKTNVWLQIYWKDYQLSWDPDEYGGITSIKIPSEYVWVPDLVLFNNADGNFEVTYKPKVVLYNTSLVNWIPPAIYQSSCSIDVEYFPFDQQICEMNFGSWTYKGEELSYSFYNSSFKLDLNPFLRSGSWDLVDCPGRIITVNNTEGGKQQLIVYRFVLRRKTLFYIVNLIIPCVLISFLSMFVFALPSSAQEKMGLSLSILLSLVVFLLLISAILPPSLTIPLLARLLIFDFIMGLIAIFANVFLINVSMRTPSEHTMPIWVRVIFLRELPKYLYIERPGHLERWGGNHIIDGDTHLSRLAKETYLFNRKRLRVKVKAAIPENKPSNLTKRQGPSKTTSKDISLSRTQLKTASKDISFSRQQSNTASKDISITRTQSNTASKDISCSLTQFNEDDITSYSSGSSISACAELELRFRKPCNNTNNSHISVMSRSAIPAVLKQAMTNIKFMKNRIKKDDAYTEVQDDWKFVARVVDRLLLIVFLMVMFCGTIGILLNSPHVLKKVDDFCHP